MNNLFYMEPFDRIVKLSDLKADIETAESSKDIRIFVMYAHLYSEYYITALHKNLFKDKKYLKCDTCHKFKVPKFKQQVEDLVNHGLIPKVHGHDNIIIIINDFRNELVHNLKFSYEELEKMLIERVRPVINDPTGLINKLLKNCSPWDNLKMAIFASITNLYHEYEKMNDRVPEQTIHFETNPEATKASIVIKPF